MGNLWDEMQVEKHWENAYERLKLKRFMKKEDAEILEELWNSGIKSEFLKDLEEGTYTWATPKKVLLSKRGTSKKRTVYLYPMKDRLILGALYRAFSEYFKDSFSSNCFSYKSGVKTIDAMEYLMSDSSLREKFGVKLDIKAYFNSVNKETIEKSINELFKGEDIRIKRLIEDLYYNEDVIINGVISKEFKSLIPGTPISSFFANYCLKELDDYVVNGLNLTYARYSDDIIFFSETKEGLQKGLDKFNEQLSSKGLSVNPDKYEWYEPGDDITYLGLKLLENNDVDISDHSFVKLKAKIKRMCRKGRKRIEMKGEDPLKVAENIFKRFNYSFYKCFIQDATKFGWGYYAFRYITTIETLRELDFYLKDRVRAMITGKNNKANIRKVPDELLKELGYISSCDMYFRFKEDFDYYCDSVDII